MLKLKKKLPDSPGVYFFKKGKDILYIGKATSLRSRVRSYFNQQVAGSRGPIIVGMVDEATSVAFRQTDSVLEAIILEAELIKKYQPRFNSKEKDNKSFFYVVITEEGYPRVLMVRGRNLQAGDNDFKIKKLFGPFPSGSELKEAMRVVRKLFPFRDKCIPNSGRPCFNRQIDLCPGVCTGETNRVDYKKQIKKIELFLSGKKKAVVGLLKKEMNGLADKREFERAEVIKRKIFALEHIQDVSLIKRESAIRPSFGADNKVFRIEAYDVAHQSGTNNVGVMVVLENGEANRGEYRKFKIRGDYPADDLRSLREVLERRLNHPEWRFPDLIVVDGGKLQLAVAEEIMKRDGLNISVVGVVKDEHHRPKNILGDIEIVKKYEREILLANSEAHSYAINYFRKLANKVRF
jgi:excinuclease ABC subunit C